MKFPTINDHPLRKVRVPHLNGGVNKTDHPSYINDNQLTDCNNMWFAGGRLRTRPGIESAWNSGGGGDFLTTFVQDGNVYLFRKEEMTSYCNGQQGGHKYIDRHVRKRPEVELKSVLVACVNEQQQGCDESKILIIGESADYGLFIGSYKPGNETITITSHEPTPEDPNKEVVFQTCNPVQDNMDIYKPTVKIGVNPSSPNAAPNGYMVQGFNLLDSSYIIKCNTEGDWAWVLPEVITPEGPASIDTIKITYTTNNSELPVQETTIFVGAYKRKEISTLVSNPITVSVKEEGSSQTVVEIDAVFKYDEDTNSVWVCCKKGDEYANDREIYSFQNNNLIIDVTCQRFKENGYGLPIDDNYSKITSMTIARWFGGTRGGLENGTRLFVAGGKEEGIIRWSDLNRPNYFSENNYAYVGDGSKITALAQQDDMLVIFQEHAITYATYIQGVEYTAEQIMNGEIVDVSTLSAQFPLTTIHSRIGCDCPDTVRLCNNRLVWLTSEGKVYCLVNNNQYNERNVREISYAIESMLKQHPADELKEAKSADAGGMYFLFVGKKIYVLDYANTSFEYYTSSAHEKKMKNYLSWYAWTLPEFVDEIISTEGIDDCVYIIADTNVSSGTVLKINLNTLKDYKTEDDVGSGEVRYYPIPCSFRTKLFAFSGDERMKRIPNCNIALCKIPGEVEVSFITDNGSGTPRHITIDEEVSEDSPDAVKRMTLYPNANSTCLFGIEMQSDSAMAVEGISISYKEMRDRQ